MVRFVCLFVFAFLVYEVLKGAVRKYKYIFSDYSEMLERSTFLVLIEKVRHNTKGNNR